jgi:HPt (histidine-containing phosphotransfer) domain-containing protein
MNQLKKFQGIELTKDIRCSLNAILEASTNQEVGELLSEILSLASSSGTIPLKAITLAKSLNPSSELLDKLNTSLEGTKLVYETIKPQLVAVDQESYQQRITRLKLKQEERKYAKLTKNLDKATSDDATLKSMMYAASVGANMVVAPISIGVLMYFFSGKLFEFVIPGYRPEPGKIDIKGVIAGVLSGVLMLFIEMILFVIRNHEMDRFMTKKAKEQKDVNPFGYDPKKAERTFEG